jgi:hypothetical protein
MISSNLSFSLHWAVNLHATHLSDVDLLLTITLELYSSTNTFHVFFSYYQYCSISLYCPSDEATRPGTSNAATTQMHRTAVHGRGVMAKKLLFMVFSFFSLFLSFSLNQVGGSVL